MDRSTDGRVDIEVVSRNDELLTRLLVVAILLPQLLAQLRIRLLHRRLAQLSRDDVVVVAVGYIGRHYATSATAGQRTAGAAAPTSRLRTAFLAAGAFAAFAVGAFTVAVVAARAFAVLAIFTV